jgi:hypothetical protein
MNNDIKHDPAKFGRAFDLVVEALLVGARAGGMSEHDGLVFSVVVMSRLTLKQHQDPEFLEVFLANMQAAIDQAAGGKGSWPGHN